jgi:hypothetical protein
LVINKSYDKYIKPVDYKQQKNTFLCFCHWTRPCRIPPIYLKAVVALEQYATGNFVEPTLVYEQASDGLGKTLFATAPYFHYPHSPDRPLAPVSAGFFPLCAAWAVIVISN